MNEVIAQLDRARNVLLEEPSLGQDRSICTSLLVDTVSEPNVLFVSFTRQARVCVEQIRNETTPQRIGVVTVGEDSSTVDDDTVITENISGPSDLTGLGIQIGQFLSEWELPIVLCFDSLTALLQYVTLETTYEFLHTITGQIHAAGARAHFHIDPSAHDAQDVAALASLFDARISRDGEMEIQTRDLLEK